MQALRGNLTSSGANGYTYTAENRMITGLGGAVLRYDPTGRLDRTAKGAAITRFGYDGADLVAEYSDAGTLLRRYVHGPSEDDSVAPRLPLPPAGLACSRYEGSTTTDRRWLHADERGSIIGVSNAAGTSIAINAYDEYGIPASTNMGRFAYTGQTWLPEVGLYYYKARMYSPTLGRFMQTDPIGYKDGINWYDYVDGDPVNRSDPDGQVGQAVAGAIIGGGLEVAIQVFVEGKDLKDVDLGDVAIAAGAGAVGQGLFKAGGRILSADLKAARAQNAATKAARRAERVASEGSRRQARGAAFRAAQKAKAAGQATKDATKTTAKAAAGVAAVEAAKKATPPVTKEEIKR